MYKIIAFDLDDTLSPAKSRADKQMIGLLTELLKRYRVAIITGGKFDTINYQIISQITDKSVLENLFIFPTIGTRMYYFESGEWKLKYSQDLKDKDAEKIKKILQDAMDELSLTPKKIWGEMIENRGSQITCSALGQEAPLEEKRKWDPDKKKRQKIMNYIKDDLADFSIGIGGTTSIDVTKKGLDKSYGMKKIIENLGVGKQDILFIGDAIFPGGNDYPVLEFGIDSKQVENPEDTKKIIKKLLNSKL